MITLTLTLCGFIIGLIGVVATSCGGTSERSSRLATTVMWTLMAAGCVIAGEPLIAALEMALAFLELYRWRKLN